MFARVMTSLALMATTVLGQSKFGCGAEHPTVDFVNLSRDFAHNWTVATNHHEIVAKREAISVNVYLQTISSDQSRVPGDDRLHQQFNLLNEVFQPYGFTFNLVEILRWIQPDWANNRGEEDMKRQLRRGDYRDLNIYVIEQSGNSAAGWCTLPGPFQQQGFTHDGCTMTMDILASPEISGKIGIHEVGHWMGLMHTFEGGCDGNADNVFDTPAENFDGNFECTPGRDSCPGHEGLDPVHNYMDYVHDWCMTEFTPGQVTLMHDMWHQFHQSLSSHSALLHGLKSAGYILDAPKFLDWISFNPSICKLVRQHRQVFLPYSFVLRRGISTAFEYCDIRNWSLKDVIDQSKFDSNTERRVNILFHAW
ncbi:Extracellular metalloprotease-like protein [Paramyrothecium foliicola]|nr:Extracellular metalloprotease-like protein [Paramyrothecium foliicola]